MDSVKTELILEWVTFALCFKNNSLLTFETFAYV